MENSNEAKRILLVDDTDMNRLVCKKMLEKFGCTVDAVADGRQCINKITEGNAYDAVFMDILMPEMDGIETFGELKKTEGFNIPVVALTADTENGAEDKYREMGFAAFLIKPFTVPLLTKVLEEI